MSLVTIVLTVEDYLRMDADARHHFDRWCADELDGDWREWWIRSVTFGEGFVILERFCRPLVIEGDELRTFHQTCFVSSLPLLA